MKMKSIISGILLAASMLSGCAVSDDGGFNFADPPYVLNVSGVVLSSEGGLPDMTVTLASYAVEDVVYASPLAKKSVQTDADGKFLIQWHETKSNVAYALKSWIVLRMASSIILILWSSTCFREARHMTSLQALIRCPD